VAIHAVERMRPVAGQTIAVVGAGTIGIALAVALRARGIEKVFILDKIAEKLELAQAFGAIPINVDTEDAAAVIAAATGNRGADGVFEAVGAAATVRSAYDLCGIGGTVVLVGNLAKEFTLPLQGVTSR